ncbi:MAG: signal peptide peptidase SppA [Candidatus Dadabacteria bacterium]|nr:MAG: signal peptide peptidase SppA [Candidatus Dadabacteria bacterium]
MTPKKFVLWVLALCAAMFIVFVLLPITTISTIAIAAKSFAGKSEIQPKNAVAVVEVDGMIWDTKEVIEQLYEQADKDNIKAIVLRVNSPGGAIGPAQEIYWAVKKIREKKPVVASMGAVAASGGLYVSLGANKILCQPGTLTGSIGVLLQLPNVSRIADLVGFKMVTVTSGALKDAGNAFREVSERDLRYFQSTVNEAYKAFVEAVAESRNLNIEKVKEFSDGRVLLGSQAVKLGLVDGFGDVMDAAREALALSGHPLKKGETPKLVYPGDKMRYLRKFLHSAHNLWRTLVGGKIKFMYLMAP